MRMTLPRFEEGCTDDAQCLKFITLASGLSAIAVGLVSTLLGSAAAALLTFVALCVAGVCVVRLLYRLAERIQDLRYSKWQYGRKREKEAAAQITKHLADLVMCPLSFEIPPDPVVTNTGLIFSKRWLYRYFKQFNTRICPLTKAPIHWWAGSFPIRELCAELNCMAAMAERDLARELSKV